jgi:hypothetical protein
MAHPARKNLLSTSNLISVSKSSQPPAKPRPRSHQSSSLSANNSRSLPRPAEAGRERMASCSYQSQKRLKETTASRPESNRASTKSPLMEILGSSQSTTTTTSRQLNTSFNEPTSQASENLGYDGLPKIKRGSRGLKSLATIEEMAVCYAACQTVSAFPSAPANQATNLCTGISWKPSS